MSPATEKLKTRTTPNFLDNTPILELAERLKKATPEKREYLLNRIGGKRGTPDLRPKPTVFKTSPTTIGFDNDGNMVAKSRDVRRRRESSDPQFTKNTWKMTPRKELKRKRKLGRR